MIPAEAIVVRQYVPDTDKAFIYSTWLRNYKHSSYFAKRIRPHVFFSGHHKIVDHLMGKAQAFVAHPKDDPDTILGYLVCELGDRPVVHFTFVKEAFRKMGIMRALLKASHIDMEKLVFTHWTLPVDELIRKYPDIIYDPYRL